MVSEAVGQELTALRWVDLQLQWAYVARYASKPGHRASACQCAANHSGGRAGYPRAPIRLCDRLAFRRQGNCRFQIPYRLPALFRIFLQASLQHAVQRRWRR